MSINDFTRRLVAMFLSANFDDFQFYLDQTGIETTEADVIIDELNKPDAFSNIVSSENSATKRTYQCPLCKGTGYQIPCVICHGAGVLLNTAIGSGDCWFCLSHKFISAKDESFLGAKKCTKCKGEGKIPAAELSDLKYASRLICPVRFPFSTYSTGFQAGDHAFFVDESDRWCVECPVCMGIHFVEEVLP